MGSRGPGRREATLVEELAAVADGGFDVAYQVLIQPGTGHDGLFGFAAVDADGTDDGEVHWVTAGWLHCQLSQDRPGQLHRRRLVADDLNGPEGFHLD